MASGDVVSRAETKIPTIKEGKNVTMVGSVHESGQVSVQMRGINRPILIDEFRAGLGRLSNMLSDPAGQ